MCFAFAFIADLISCYLSQGKKSFGNVLFRDVGQKSRFTRCKKGLLFLPAGTNSISDYLKLSQSTVQKMIAWHWIPIPMRGWAVVHEMCWHNFGTEVSKSSDDAKMSLQTRSRSQWGETNKLTATVIIEIIIRQLLSFVCSHWCHVQWGSLNMLSSVCLAGFYSSDWNCNGTILTFSNGKPWLEVLHQGFPNFFHWCPTSSLPLLPGTTTHISLRDCKMYNEVYPPWLEMSGEQCDFLLWPSVAGVLQFGNPCQTRCFWKPLAAISHKYSVECINQHGPHPLCVCCNRSYAHLSVCLSVCLCNTSRPTTSPAHLHDALDSLKHS